MLHGVKLDVTCMEDMLLVDDWLSVTLAALRILNGIACTLENSRSASDAAQRKLMRTEVPPRPGSRSAAQGGVDTSVAPVAGGRAGRAKIGGQACAVVASAW